MKKFLIFLILFTSIFIVGNAKAITSIDNFDFTVYNSDFTFPYKTEELGTYEDNYNRAYQYYLDNCQGIYDSYIIDKTGYGYGFGDNQVNLLCFNKSDNAWIPSVEMYYNQDSSIWLNYRIEIFKPNNNNYIVQHFYNTSSTNSYSYNQFNFDLYNYEKINNKTLSKESGIIDTNIKFYFNSNQYEKGKYAINSFIYDGKTYTVGDLIYESGSFVGNKPTITFSKTENTENVNDTELVTSVDLNVKFSSIDNEKYIYRYKILPSENWTTMTLTSKDNFDIHLTSNTSVVVEILDLETKEIVTSATYTIDSIYDIDVSISITKKEDLNCIANYNNTQVETCANLDIYFSYINFDKYYYQYSIDNGNNYIDIKSDDIKNNIFNYILNNEYLIVRVIDKTTKVEKAINTYTFSKFQEIPKEPYINFEIYYTFDMCAEDEIGTTICVNYEMMKSDKFNEIDKNKVEIKNMSATLFVKIYNYNENYNYYYYDDTGGCIKITKSLLKNDGYSYYYTSIDLYSNVQVTVDIHDENNNYLKSYTYTVNGFENEKKETTFESMLEKIKSIFKNDNNIFDYFNTIYTKLRDSKIGTYLYFVIISSIILLIINALQR